MMMIHILSVYMWMLVSDRSQLSPAVPHKPVFYLNGCSFPGLPTTLKIGASFLLLIAIIIVSYCFATCYLFAPLPWTQCGSH